MELTMTTRSRKLYPDGLDSNAMGHETRPHGATPLPCVLGSRAAAWRGRFCRGLAARGGEGKKKGKKKVRIPCGYNLRGWGMDGGL
jgi:hypothetical protein